MMLFIVTLVFGGLQGEVVTLSKQSHVFSALGTGEYFGEIYTEGKTGDLLGFVYFVGEPIKLEVSIANPGPDELFRFTGTTAEDMFRIETFRDEAPFAISVSVDQGRWRRLGGQVLPFNRQEPTRLKAHEKVEWKVEVDTSLPPGRYKVRIAPNAVDGKGLPIVPRVATYDFEVRASSRAAQAEIARREALRYSSSNDPSELNRAYAASERLLQVNPHSYAAYLVRGRIAQARGDHAQATAEYEKAAAILRTDQDELLKKFKPGAEREELRRSADALVGRKP